MAPNFASLRTMSSVSNRLLYRVNWTHESQINTSRKANSPTAPQSTSTTRLVASAATAST